MFPSKANPSLFFTLDSSTSSRNLRFLAAAVLTLPSVWNILLARPDRCLWSACNVKRSLAWKHKKTDFCICENKSADPLRSNNAADQRLFSLYFLNMKFQASSHLLWLYSPVSVGPGWKPQRQVFMTQLIWEASRETLLYVCGNNHADEPEL